MEEDIVFEAYTVKWYCGQCKTEFEDHPRGSVGHLKPPCPNCKDKTDYKQIFELLGTTTINKEAIKN